MAVPPITVTVGTSVELFQLISAVGHLRKTTGEQGEALVFDVLRDSCANLLSLATPGEVRQILSVADCDDAFLEILHLRLVGVLLRRGEPHTAPLSADLRAACEKLLVGLSEAEVEVLRALRMRTGQKPFAFSDECRGAQGREGG